MNMLCCVAVLAAVALIVIAAWMAAQEYRVVVTVEKAGRAPRATVGPPTRPYMLDAEPHTVQLARTR